MRRDGEPPVDRERRAASGADGAREEAEVARLLAAAGRRPPLPAEDLEQISAGVRAAWRAHLAARAVPQSRPRWFQAAAALAAALALALGVAWWWRASPRSPAVAWVEATSGSVEVRNGRRAWRAAEAGEGVPRGAELRTSRTAQGEPAPAGLHLAGGVTLRLDRGSRLALTAPHEVALAAGAVYVDTGAHGAVDGGTLLAVRTRWGLARDIGTQFAVRVIDDAAMRVQVRQGAVAVERGNRSWLTAAGHAVVLHRDGRIDRQSLAAADGEWAWALGRPGLIPAFDPEGRTVREMLDWVEAATGWEVRYADHALAAEVEGIVLHGEVRNLRADQAAFTLLPAAGLEGELRDGVLYVRRLAGG